MTTTARSQAQRRAATIDKLLDATIQALCDVGVGALTTRGVAELAGVSQGAQQHYFPTKGALISAAMERLVAQLAAEAIADPVRADTESERVVELLDRLWELHNLPLCPAVLELFNAARTDPQIAAEISGVVRTGMASIRMVAATLLPTYSRQPEFDDFLDMATSTIRGMVTLTSVPGLADAHSEWPQVRTLLVRVLAPRESH